MLSKTQINKKLQEKRSEQIKLEYDSLNDLKIKYENEILTMKDKIYNWEIEEQALKQSSLDNKNQLINIKDSDIAGKIDTLLELPSPEFAYHFKPLILPEVLP